MMNFASDNWAGAHETVTASLSRHADGFERAYGQGELDRKVAAAFNDIFEREVAVFYVATGTAANSLSLAAVNRTGGVAFCHRQAHVIEDECGAPEHLTGGARLCAVDGEDGRLDPEQLELALARYPADFLHAGRPMAVSITQATELGTVYRSHQIDAIGEICRRERLPLHMDGARFANALVSLDTTPAEMTWKRGIDILSFGATKNGCWCAEAVVLFDAGRAGEFAFIRKRAAQLFSKSRFVAAQFEAYFAGDLWLQNARHANAMAARLADAVRQSDAARLAWEPEANEVFVILDNPLAARLRSAGATFYDQHPPAGFKGHLALNETLCRFVASFATQPEEVARFADFIAGGRERRTAP